MMCQFVTNKIGFLFYILLYLNGFSCEVRNVENVTQFQAALDGALPGDVIKLVADQLLFEDHEFSTVQSGDPDNPITITGSGQPGGFARIKLRASSSDEKGTTALTISGDFWKIENIEFLISHPHVGVWIDGNNNTLTSLFVTAYETGLYLSGSGNSVESSIINSTHGTGLHLLGDRNTLTGSVIEGAEWSLFAGHDVCCNEIAGNTLKGAAMIQGDQNQIKDNFLDGDLLVPDCDQNEFLRNVVEANSPPGYSENCSLTDPHKVMFIHAG